MPMYILLDANVTAAYYLARSSKSANVRKRSEIMFNSVRSGASDHFFYLPNFCVAEIFSVFMKYCFGDWNTHVKKTKGTIDSRHYRKIVAQFSADIHNGKFIYHYELSRYHVLAINLVAPVDHYFQISRGRRRGSGRKAGTIAKKNVNPMGTFDHLIIAMGLHLVRIHGRENVLIVSADDRLTKVLSKCKTKIPSATIRKLKLDSAQKLTGIPFSPESFPNHVNFTSATNKELKVAFGCWPLPPGKVPKVGRYTVV